MKPRWLDASPNHLSCIETRPEPTNIDDGFPDAQLFWVELIDDHYSPIIQFLATRISPEDLSTSPKKQLVVKDLDFQLRARKLYKLGPNEIL